MKYRAALAVFICMLCLSVMPAQADETLKVLLPEEIAGYQENIITVDCPCDGVLTCGVYQGDGELLYEMMPVEVCEGLNDLSWDGLGAWDQPLPQGAGFVKCTLDDGEKSVVGKAYFEMVKPVQALVFALGSDAYFNPGGEEWYVTYKLVRSGYVIIELWHDELTDAPLKTFKKQVSDAKPTTWTWRGTINGKRAADGQYTLRLYAENNPEYMQEVHVAVDSNFFEPAVDLTGKLMPAEKYDVPACAAAPAVVAVGGSGASLKIYMQPDTTSRVLGTVDAAVQCLEVHAVDGAWAEVTAYRQEDGTPIRGFCRSSRIKAVPVHEEYVLVVSRDDSMMTVWQDGAAIGSLPVTLGGAVEKHPERETVSGSFIIGKRATAVTLREGRFDYAIKLGDSFTIHQADPSIHEGPTQGDIAAAASTDESRLSAYWLWTHIPPNTRVIILDDPQSRLMRVACANAGTAYEIEGWDVYEPEEPESGTHEIVMTFGGDVALGSREKWMGQKEAFPAYLEKYGLAYPLQGMKELFSSDHMTVVNLETVLKADGEGEKTDRLVRLRGLPEWVEALRLSSVEQVNVANNHHKDYGRAGEESTLAALDAAAIPYSGYGYTYIAEIDGCRIGFGGCRETTWLQGNQDIAGEIAYLRENGCDVIVYSCHWGKEYAPAHNETQERMAQAVADAGADLIIGHHPHVVQGVGMIDGVPVIYSLGNLMFGGTHDMKTFDGAVARISFRFGEHGYEGMSVTMIPVTTSTAAHLWVNDYHPVPATGEDALRILAKIQADSTMLIQENMFFPAR